MTAPKSALTAADKVAAAKLANDAKQAPKFAAAKAARAATKAARAATKATKATTATKPKAIAKPTIRPDQCVGGRGAYGSPAIEPQCTKKRLGVSGGKSNILCAHHEAVWAAEAKRRRAAASPKAEKAPKSAGSTAKAGKLVVVKSTPATMESELAAVKKLRREQPAPVAAAAADAMTICNGCDVNPALPDSAAGYCADCDGAAKTRYGRRARHRGVARAGRPPLIHSTARLRSGRWCVRQ